MRAPARAAGVPNWGAADPRPLLDPGDLMSDDEFERLWPAIEDSLRPVWHRLVGQFSFLRGEDCEAWFALVRMSMRKRLGSLYTGGASAFAKTVLRNLVYTEGRRVAQGGTPKSS